MNAWSDEKIGSDLKDRYIENLMDAGGVLILRLGFCLNLQSQESTPYYIVRICVRVGAQRTVLTIASLSVG